VNTLKPLLICAVLAGIGYGVYVRINNGHDTPPPGVAEGWSSGPQVQLGDTTSAPGPAAWPGSSAGASAAPPFAPPPGAGSTPGAEAPQFQTSPPPHTMAADAGGLAILAARRRKLAAHRRLITKDKCRAILLA